MFSKLPSCLSLLARRGLLLLLLWCGSHALVSVPAQAQETQKQTEPFVRLSDDIAYMEEAQEFGEDFSPVRLMNVADKLIKKGKEAAIKDLKKYVKLNGLYRLDTTFILCGAVFKPKKKEDWRKPGLGVSLLKNEEEDSFETFPILFANKVPFILLNGYWLEGFPEMPEGYIDYCAKTLEFRTEPYGSRDIKDIKDAAEEAAKIVHANGTITRDNKVEILRLLGVQVKNAAIPFKPGKFQLSDSPWSPEW